MTSSNGILADVGTIDEAFAALSKGGGNWGMESGRSADKIQTPANLLASTKGENGEDLQWSVPGLAAKICRACMGKRRVFREEAFGPGALRISCFAGKQLLHVHFNSGMSRVMEYHCEACDGTGVEKT